MTSNGKTGIVNYGMGNLGSVFNAMKAVGADVRILQQPQELSQVTHVILPGVGAFGDGMRSLKEGGWISALDREVREKGRPFLGICLGMQLLAARGTEHGDHEGLGWIPGSVLRLSDEGGTLRVPHIGWNDVQVARPDGIYPASFSSGVFYFVHSFHFVPDDPSVVDGRCPYGPPFAASISRGNIWAVQYHPEKSQREGLNVLRSFLARR
jgi:glutamine amidotransferase